MNDLETNEYLVIAYTSIQPFAETDEQRQVKDIFSVRTQNIQIKTIVDKYQDARYRVLATALRVRNYAAYFAKSRHPLSFSIVGQRDEVVNNTLLGMPAIFDGTTHLPFTDAGLGTTSAFITRFGPDDGLKPPYHEFDSKEAAAWWIENLNRCLKFTNRMLDSITEGSDCDVAVSCIGESFWLDEATARFLACWRAIDTITRLDHRNGHVSLEQIGESVRKRSKAEWTDERLRLFRKMRNVAAHRSPPAEDFRQYHDRLAEVYQLARELADSAIKEQTSVDRELDWNPNAWRKAV